jgi:hypothetical protein
MDELKKCVLSTLWLCSTNQSLSFSFHGSVNCSRRMPMWWPSMSQAMLRMNLRAQLNCKIKQLRTTSHNCDIWSCRVSAGQLPACFWQPKNRSESAIHPCHFKFDLSYTIPICNMLMWWDSMAVVQFPWVHLGLLKVDIVWPMYTWSAWVKLYSH